MPANPSPKNIPSITVVVPTFNQAKTLDQTLTSIMDHNNSEGLEVLVFDSMSTDGTSKVLNKWENRCTIIREKDRGQSDAINKGFRKAKGEIICWLNSDDIFFPNALDQVRQSFSENPATQVLSGRGVHLFQDGGFKITFPENLDFGKSVSNDFQTDILQPTVFFRRDLVEKIGGINPRLNYVMDWDLWCRFLKAKAIWLTVENFFSAARVHSATKTSSGGLLRLFEHWQTTKKYTGSFLPRSTRRVFFSWGLEDAPQPISSLFKLAYNLKSFFLFKEIIPNIHNAKFCQGETHIKFPWYGGRSNSIKIELEFDNLPENITLDINDKSFVRKSSSELKKQIITIDQPFEQILFNLRISTETSVRFRVLKITPLV
jgi:glycosyltransferase involved in cell wall biosynthesis